MHYNEVHVYVCLCSNMHIHALPDVQVVHTLQHAATCCNTLQHAATVEEYLNIEQTLFSLLFQMFKYCNTLQHTATRYSTLQHTAKHCNSTIERKCVVLLQRVAACCSVLQRVAACCSVLQCVVACCSVL